MMRRFVSAKIHHIRVTEAELNYIGSVTIDRELMRAADIEPYEQVDVVNLNNGERWTTYALPGKSGVFSLNGGGARVGRPGDVCVVMSYRDAETFPGATALILNESNDIIETLRYPLDHDRPEDGPSVETS